MQSNNQNLMFGKYQVIRSLGQGATSSVLLVRHLNLDVERAIKISPKTALSSHSILSEATLLKSLDHPGIPRIYDVEEDSSNFYLIEEYIEGQTFEEYFLNQQFLSPELFYEYALQLCDIFGYLHAFSQDRIHYQDLKPEHVLLAAGRIKLIDFCLQINDPDHQVRILGNNGFSAPEVLSSEPPTVRSDVYTLGAFLAYLADHVEGRLSSEIASILKKASSAQPSDRYPNVGDLRAALEKSKKEKSLRTSCKTIAVIGSFHGCGTTHIAIALTCVLNYLNLKSLYLEMNSSDDMRKAKAYCDRLKEKDGFYYNRHFYGMPKYGPGVRILLPKDRIQIFDLSDQINALNDQAIPDLILLVVDASCWRIADAIAMNEYLSPYKGQVKILCNPGNKAGARKLSKALGRPVYSYVDDPDPFSVTRSKISFFKKLLSL